MKHFSGRDCVVHFDCLLWLMIKMRALNIFLAESQMHLAKGTNQATNKQQQQQQKLENNILAYTVVLSSNDFKGFSKGMNYMEWNHLRPTSHIIP